MFDQQHGHVEFVAQAADQRLQVHLFLRVQAGGRFVQHQQPGAGDHAAGNFQPALVAVGQIAGLAVGIGVQAHEVQPPDRTVDGLGFGSAVGGQAQQARQQPALYLRVLGHQQVFQHGQLFEQPHVLEGAHHAVTGHDVTGPARHVLAIEPDAPAAGLVEAADAVEHRGLARPVGADDGKDLVAPHGQRHLVHRQQAAKAHGQTGHVEQRSVRVCVLHLVTGAHRVSSTCGRLTGSRPCGRQIIISTITRPNSSIR